MEQKSYLQSSFVLSSENTDIPFDDIDEDSFMDNDEDEDEHQRHVTELEKERCPKCLSPFLELYSTKKGLKVLRCKGCKSLLCQRCVSILEKVKASDGRKKLHCPKCGFLE